MSKHPEAVRLRIEYECRPFLGSWDYAPPDAPMNGDGEEYGPVYLALPAPTFDALMAERDELQAEVARLRAALANALSNVSVLADFTGEGSEPERICGDIMARINAAMRPAGGKEAPRA